jgi:hypothetical protein
VPDELPAPRHVRIDPTECRFCPFLNAPPDERARSRGKAAGRALGSALWSVTRQNYCGVCGCIVAGKALLGRPCPLEEGDLTASEMRQRRKTWAHVREATGASFEMVRKRRFG